MGLGFRSNKRQIITNTILGVLSTFRIWEFPKIRGYLCRGPYSKDPSV